jgi:hypothetical protein
MTSHFFSLSVGRWTLDVERFPLLYWAFGVRCLPRVFSLSVGRWTLAIGQPRTVSGLSVERFLLLPFTSGVRRSAFDFRCFLP